VAFKKEEWIGQDSKLSQNLREYMKSLYGWMADLPYLPGAHILIVRFSPSATRRTTELALQ
jgi:hypothetical protein